ncbi:interleukin-20 receptor subunit beta isoform X1 [Takifugu rubripes]|uniref:interleukin-20 receptor subunit beta isoform X1 n=1 Tax=Takifugu rubripes TaxID=31033 RepID=UPI0005D1C453|nr:interleukin-20 receptor subunit beta-like isoform X1 [Takifugu rubripes]|eukprot:XP_011615686.1 PREDICTED: interleukin-20 receptor subunit beta-like isoform X1 [Takifugu rubripes]
MVTMETSRLLLLLLTLKMRLGLQDGIWTPSSPRHVHMDSVNMRHVLGWLPLQDNCSTTVLYSVQFQGEFELMVLNGSWVNAHDCQLTPETSCDLTSDLGSDSDYNLRVRAHCGSQTSAWAKASSPFNRRDTFVTAPLLEVTSERGGLQVSISKPPGNAVVTVTSWKRGDKLQQKVIPLEPEQTLLHIAALQVGGEYCVRAQVLLGTRSSTSDTHCVFVTHTDSGLWKTVTTVVVTAAVMATLLAVLFWSISRCRPGDCQTFFQKEALPPSLLNWDVSIMTSPEGAEPLEAVSVMLVVLSTKDVR